MVANIMLLFSVIYNKFIQEKGFNLSLKASCLCCMSVFDQTAANQSAMIVGVFSLGVILSL